MTAHRQELRRLLAGSQCLAAPGVWDGLSTLLVEQAGFHLAFVSGGAVSFARHGRPDMGLVSAAEMADTVAILRERSELPLLVDMDTGFGNALNVQRTVRSYELAGASALQLEDQTFPKRCGHMSGKTIIGTDEMVGKLQAALDARQDEDLHIIARTDAVAVTGFADAMERAHRYVETGADLLFIEGPETLEQMQAISDAFGDRVPLVHNLVEGGVSAVRSLAELNNLNYRVGLFPIAMLNAFVPRAREILEIIARDGRTDRIPGPFIDLSDMNQLLGADELLARGEKFSGE